VDSIAIAGYDIQIIEWKHIGLDFLVLPGEYNGPKPKEEETIAKPYNSET